MANRAVERLRVRLRNQQVLIRIADDVGVNGGGTLTELGMEDKDDALLSIESWFDIRSSMRSEASLGSS